ncbi:MAG TPA: MotA/TolQ/ExbB proton channel family protein [Novosphingobium sp.]|nr:MotA/TolQ/ExbB proton channel family protein [Novosphingobium sp.]
MNLASFYDGPTLAIVVGGTLVATVLRCGLGDARATLRALADVVRAGRGRFDAEALRAGLARALQEILRDGLLRAHPHRLGDEAFDAALDALVAHRSFASARTVLERARQRRLALPEAAVRTLNQAAELAPVLGLAGTLISLSKLPANGIDRGAYMAAIGMAVHSTLYGLVMANLLLTPLARLVERRMRAEDEARQKLSGWLEFELASAFPNRREFAAAPAEAATIGPDTPQPGDEGGAGSSQRGRKRRWGDKGAA